MFVRRAVFEELGGFPPIPFMEDLEMSRRLRRRGHLLVLPVARTASASRLVQRGPWRMTVPMQVLKAR